MENNHEKTVVPKIYGILIESNKNFFLSVQYAYCLEEAFYLAKLEFIDQNAKLGKFASTLEGAKIGLFTTREIGSLAEDLTKIKTKDVTSIYPINDEKSKGSDNIADEVIDEIFDMLAETAPPGLQPLKKQPVPKVNKPELAEIKPQKTSIDIKNELMKSIIDNNDTALFRQNINKFTAAEKRYIQERLK